MLIIIASIAEGFGILMLLPLLQRLDGTGVVQTDTDGSKDAQQFFSALLNDALTWMDFQDSVAVVLVIITIAFLIKGILIFGALAYSAFLRGELMRELKRRLFDEYSCMSFRYYSRKDAGYFINLINDQITRSLQAFDSLTQLGAQILSSHIYLGLALLVTWQFGLMAIIAGFILLFLFRGLNYYVRALVSQRYRPKNHFTA